MSVTSATSSTSTSIATPYVPGSLRVPQKNLGQDDFLKLLTVQLAKQDPMKPMEDTSFIAQMAQFTALQQTTEMVSGFSDLRSASEMSTASSLLGRNVTVETKEDGKVTGQVTGIDAADGTPKLIVNGKLFPLSSLKQVATEVAQTAA
jgi:flagellar basal-body rod modification protein FlgD